jgi:hypothetical protein
MSTSNARIFQLFFHYFPAADIVLFTNFVKRDFFLCAAIFDERTSTLEFATWGGVKWGWDIPFKGFPFTTITWLGFEYG